MRRLVARLALLCGLLAAPAAAAPPAPQAHWPMERGNVRGTARVRIALPGIAPVKGWRFEAGSHVWGYQPGMTVWSSPALGVVGGRPLVLAGSYDRNLYALDGETGEQRWRFTTGGGVHSTPALWRGTRETGGPLVFAASSDRLLYAISADLGRRRWIYTVKSWRPTMGGARLSAPCVGRAGDRHAVFFGHWVWDKSISGHMQVAGLTAVDALTGKALWTADLGDNRVNSPVCARMSDGAWRVFVGSDNGNLYCLDAATGDVRWSYTERESVMGTPALWLADKPGGGPDRVYFGSKYGRLRCLDARDGRQLWRFATSHWVDGAPTLARVADRQLLLAGSYDTRMYALDATTGAPRWSHRVGGGIYSGGALATHDGADRVLFSAWDHHLHCVNLADGALAWSAFTGRPIWDSLTLGDSTWSSPAVAEINGQAVAYFGSYSGPFYAVPLQEAEHKALARPGSNLKFWVTLPLVMLATAAAAIFLTRRRRGRV